jgi:hypothetical protein
MVTDNPTAWQPDGEWTEWRHLPPPNNTPIELMRRDWIGPVVLVDKTTVAPEVNVAGLYWRHVL